jgi:hypothetical protein
VRGCRYRIITRLILMDFRQRKVFILFLVIAKIFLLVEQIRPRRSEIDDFGASIRSFPRRVRSKQ